MQQILNELVTVLCGVEASQGSFVFNRGGIVPRAVGNGIIIPSHSPAISSFCHRGE
jgi:hypothetical protein